MTLTVTSLYSNRSARGFTFMYGKVEVKAKLPLGDWLWPAIWLLPKRHK
jgi:beta-glucanase (GH16 family)